jgi:hypothetical protein
MLTLADLYDEAFIGARASILTVLLLLQGTPVENNSEGEGEGKGDDAEEEDNEVTEFWLELACIQLFVLGRTCQSGTKMTTMKNKRSSRGGSKIRLEAARPLADDGVLRCVFVICSRLLSLQHDTGTSPLELSLDRRRSSCAV